MTRAIILDANCFSETNLRDEIKRKIKDDDLCLIWSKGGQLHNELKNANRIRYRQYALAKKFFCVCNVCVDRKANHLMSNGNLNSNDAHIVALALVSGANVLATEDSCLIEDFTNCNNIDRLSLCIKRQGSVISRKVIKTSTDSRDVVRLLNNASARYEHCPCQCSQTGC